MRTFASNVNRTSAHAKHGLQTAGLPPRANPAHQLAAKRDFVEGSIDGFGFGREIEGALDRVELVLIHQHVLADPPTARRGAGPSSLARGDAHLDTCITSVRHL
jgi:hypothetical protein